jgi:hypothetical protein
LVTLKTKLKRKDLKEKNTLFWDFENNNKILNYNNSIAMNLFVVI